MDTATAAATAGVTVATIRTWCRIGAVAATKVAGRWVISPTSLTRRIALGQRPAPRKETPMPAKPAVGYRKTKGGEWVVCGAAGDIHVGPITVTRKDGTSQQEHVVRVGKDFTGPGGAIMRYGYLAPRTARPATRPDFAGNAGYVTTGELVAAARGARPARQTCDECGGHGARHHRTDSSGIPGMVCGACNRRPAYMLSFA